MESLRHTLPQRCQGGNPDPQAGPGARHHRLHRLKESCPAPAPHPLGEDRIEVQALFFLDILRVVPLGSLVLGASIPELWRDEEELEL